jgi:hypothetical protein
MRLEGHAMTVNTSGQGSTATVPAEIDRWNWGAFLLTWIWGIGNNTLVALLALVPLVNLVMPFVLGAKGSAWAWRNKHWDSVEHFRRVQRSWAKWGLALWLAMIGLVVAMIFGTMSLMKRSEAYTMAIARAQTDAQVQVHIGLPFTAGTPSGSVVVSGPSGTADLSFDVEGPKGKGTIYVKAHKDMGKWEIDRMVLEDAATGERFEISPPRIM